MLTEQCRYRGPDGHVRRVSTRQIGMTDDYY